MDNQSWFMYSLSGRVSGANWGHSHIVCGMVSSHDVRLMYDLKWNILLLLQCGCNIVVA
jgi:hypothetical protein